MNDIVTTEAAAEPALDPHETAAAALSAEAAQLRADTAQAQQDATQALATAQAEAARTVREAQAAVHEAQQAAARAERHVEDLEGAANLHRHALALRNQIADLENRIADLDEETGDLTARADGLSARLAQIAVDQQAARVGIDTAIDQGDAEAVAALRATIAGTDEIAAALTAKATGIRQRILAIGVRADGAEARTEIPSAVRRLESLKADQERVLDALDPQRPGAELRASLAQLQRLSAYAAAHPQPKAYTKQQTTVNVRADGTVRADIART